MASSKVANILDKWKIDMNYSYAVYNSNGGLIARTLTKGKALQIAGRFLNAVVKDEKYQGEII